MVAEFDREEATEERIMAAATGQVAAYNLPTRPAKAKDTSLPEFAAQYGNACVELDALPPDVLTDLVRDSIESVIDWAEWKRMQQIEDREREGLAEFMATFDES
jgi:hypothetical protein